MMLAACSTADLRRSATWDLGRIVIERFARGESAYYQRCDLPSETIAEWHTIDPAPSVIIDGVSTGRFRVAAYRAAGTGKTQVLPSIPTSSGTRPRSV